jgi:ABC-type transporter Mla subunit MlaD
MTESEFIAAAERLETIHKQFANMVMMLVGGFEKLEKYLEAYSTSFEANLDSYHQTTEMLHSYGDALRQLLAAMQSVTQTAAENNTALNETNGQLKTLIARFDTHFGDTAGLEYDN